MNTNLYTVVLFAFISLAWSDQLDEFWDDVFDDPDEFIDKRGISEFGCNWLGIGCGSEEDNANYGVLFDAGSSSTKLKVYRVTPNEDSSALPNIDIVFSQRFDPGVDSFVNDYDGLREYLVNILNVAIEKVPENKRSDTPIYLYATAGLRFLEAEDAKALTDGIKGVFQDNSLSPFRFKPSGVGILSGEEEGVYAWIAANYLLGFFNGDQEESVGVLEMGGGSTQITFVPRSDLYEGEFQVIVKGRKYEVYVHSYLQFGINAINQWVAEIIYESKPKRKRAANPCMLRGDTTTITLQNGKTLALNGSSDPALCEQILEKILTPETGIRCEPKPCAIGSVYQPSVDDIKFLATQGFTYAPATLHAIGEDQVLDLQELERAAIEHCQRSLDEAVEAGIRRELASTTCLMGLYIRTLFTLSYGFPADTRNIRATSNVGNATVDWSLGAMVAELSGPENSVKRRQI